MAWAAADAVGLFRHANENSVNGQKLHSFVELVRFNVSFGDDAVAASVEFVKIVPWIGVMDKIGKFLAVAGTSGGIYVENHIASRGQHLLFKIETAAVVGEGTAVNFKNQRILFGRIEIRRVNDPALDFTIVF